jgi:3-methyl-2-oxobutanoate hydroxymethyltransferase
MERAEQAIGIHLADTALSGFSGWRVFCFRGASELQSQRETPPMSTVSKQATREHRVTVPSLDRRKQRAQKITMLTAYDFTFASIFDAAEIDILLVGDSLGNVVQGLDSTLPVTLDEVVYHTRMVARAARRALVIGDMPFGSYQISAEEAVRNAFRLVKDGGAHAVKLEGGCHVAATIERIVAAEIPVMGHVGLTPQAVNRMGGHRVQGRGEKGRARVIADARAVQDAGAFSVVLEGVPEDLAREITGLLSIPTIGIGAGVHCDGQVLVMHDMLGLTDWSPSFAKQYANLGALASQAARNFAEEVTNSKFPDEAHSYR